MFSHFLKIFMMVGSYVKMDKCKENIVEIRMNKRAQKMKKIDGSNIN